VELIPYYVRQDLRPEVLDTVVPYVRSGRNEDEVTNYIAGKLKERTIRHGFYKVVKDLRCGNCGIESAYVEEFTQ